MVSFFKLIINHNFGNYIEQDLEALAKIVNKYVGAHHLSRNEFSDHNTSIATYLTVLNDPSKLFVIFDGTYTHCQKSQNYNSKKNIFAK